MFNDLSIVSFVQWANHEFQVMVAGHVFTVIEPHGQHSMYFNESNGYD